MRPIIPALIAVLAAASPAPAQDLLTDFEDFIEDMLPQRQASPRTAPVAPTQPIPAEARSAEPDRIEVPPLPRPRPEPPRPAPPAAGAAPPATPPTEAEAEPERPERIYQTACPALLSGLVIGDMHAPVEEGICAARSPLSLTGVRVNGREIGFSGPVTTNCAMAGALADWVGAVDAYAQAALDSPIARLDTGTSMLCRNRYGAAEGFISEHGFANALDLVGFTLANGESIAVAADWLPAATAKGKLLRLAHGAACGRFTTVLGPEANADHEDHFHLDLGCHGQSCMAQLCEERHRQSGWWTGRSAQSCRGMQSRFGVRGAADRRPSHALRRGRMDIFCLHLAMGELI